MKLFALMLLLLGQFAPQHTGTEPLDPAREARVQKLGKKYRCPVCQGLSIADSPSPTARAQLDKLRELVSANKTDQEIKEYFVARYGEWALLEPEMHDTNLVLWFAPGVLLAVGFLIIVLQVKRRGQPVPVAAPGAVSAPADAPEQPVDAYVAAVRADLEK